MEWDDSGLGVEVETTAEAIENDGENELEIADQQELDLPGAQIVAPELAPV